MTLVLWAVYEGTGIPIVARRGLSRYRFGKGENQGIRFRQAEDTYWI